ncbi:uncharacterized protein LOC117011557 isoform X1 [Catharus ustulatus]|uniref:uncharacterized protein LOC117011557 isoform X1 n=1 Tax=Catharus ustulatus TaxID=91951 RepID=UPI00140B634C|nr:uncharacterized protein LOC117011557 isoform X1 [Catharus ustulatus]
MLPQPGELRPAWAGGGSASFCGASPSSTPFLPFTFHSPLPLLSLPLLLLLLFPLLLFLPLLLSSWPGRCQHPKAAALCPRGFRRGCAPRGTGSDNGSTGKDSESTRSDPESPGKELGALSLPVLLLLGALGGNWEETEPGWGYSRRWAGPDPRAWLCKSRSDRALPLVGGSSAGLPRSREGWGGWNDGGGVRCVLDMNQWHQGSAGLCPPRVTGDHPAQILPWGMELEQRTKLFLQLEHSQGFPWWCLCWCWLKLELVAHHPCSHPSKESCGYQVTEAPLLGPYKQRCTRSPWSSPGPAPPCERGLSEPGTLPFAALGASPSNDGAWADPPLLQAQPFSRWGDAKASGVSISLPCRGVPHMPWH